MAVPFLHLEKSLKVFFLFQTVFLVYMEYGMSSETNHQAVSKASWIDIMNDSLSSSLEDKFSKSRLNFDRSTIKLLPLLIKALKQNRYLEKIIEDYSSSSPTYEGKVTTEFTFKKDFVMNTKNWLKKPTTKLYSVEYKTSPGIYFRTPNKNLAYFTKIRKIRDYNRIMEYVHKMINDKVVDHTQPMLPFDYKVQTQKPIKNKNKILKKSVKTHYKERAKVLEPHNVNLKHSKQNDLVSCKCPKQLGLLINKIVSSIQHLIPYIKTDKTSPCPLLKNTVTTALPTTTTAPPRTTSTTLPITTTTVLPTTPKTSVLKKLTTTVTTIMASTSRPIISNLLEKKVTFPLLLSEFDNIFQKEDRTIASQEFDNVLSKNEVTEASIKNVRIMVTQTETDLNKYSYNEIQFVPTSIQDNIEPTESNITVSPTQPMTPIVKGINVEEPIIVVTPEKYISPLAQFKTTEIDKIEFIPAESTDNPSPDKPGRKPTYPLYSIDNDEDYKSIAFTTKVTDETIRSSEFASFSKDLFSTTQHATMKSNHLEPKVPRNKTSYVNTSKAPDIKRVTKMESNKKKSMKP
jgi:hypothetical protein